MITEIQAPEDVELSQEQLKLAEDEILQKLNDEVKKLKKGLSLRQVAFNKKVAKRRNSKKENKKFKK